MQKGTTRLKRKLYCPHCRSTKSVWKAGFQLQIGGKAPRQRYQCPDCRTFTLKPLRSPRTTKKAAGKRK